VLRAAIGVAVGLVNSVATSKLADLGSPRKPPSKNGHLLASTRQIWRVGLNLGLKKPRIFALHRLRATVEIRELYEFRQRNELYFLRCLIEGDLRR
jgi:hypothetical protein